MSAQFDEDSRTSRSGNPEREWNVLEPGGRLSDDPSRSVENHVIPGELNRELLAAHCLYL